MNPGLWVCKFLHLAMPGFDVSLVLVNDLFNLHFFSSSWSWTISSLMVTKYLKISKFAALGLR